ncbi:tripartite tricarboxylate transporter substrate binding protein [Bradyrhizobium sp. LHD-71]|uniref:Bug family tripartite tricarboxylate transporter substrate binding protein n=1 Tax=Bradyrhizobium sp. LHD-71 TaxID=3072141 RepID=UPI00280CBCF9|nr:tripartite tricarboxylate transporter substrate binding protein [Bradyrhizobium sp. LHD-71]MDQ8728156.1 tripartite tricarboxylate transporter substrate binding protein [Bradyrhizobium sp. LHD-71]
MFIRFAVCALLVLVSIEEAAAQEWQPNRPVHLTVGFSVGSTLDLMARAIAGPLGERLGQPVVVENKGGGNGRLALDLNANAQPDGYTIHLTASGPLAIDPTLREAPLPGYQAVSQVAVGPMAIVVPSSLPANSITELVALAKNKPGELNYASSGIGSTPHLAGELFASKAQVQLVHIPYKGNSDALGDMLAGRVQILFSGLPPIMPMVEAGKLRVLAVQGTERSPNLPEVPPISEAGFPGAEAYSIYGLIAPPGTEQQILARLSNAISGIVEMPSIKETFTRLGTRAVSSTPTEYAETIRHDTMKWSQVIKAAKISVK